MRFLAIAFFFVFNLVLASTVQASDTYLKLSGNFIQGGLVHGQVMSGNKIEINGHAVRVNEHGEFIIGFGRDYPATSLLKVIKSDGSTSQHSLKIQQREYKIQRIDGLPKSQVNPDEKTIVRINKERQEIKHARQI